MSKKAKGKSKAKKLFDRNQVMTTLHSSISRDLADRALAHAVKQDPEAFGPFHRDTEFLGEYRLVTEFRKRFCDGSISTDVLKERTFKKFLDVNEHMSGYRELNLPSPKRVLHSSDSLHDAILLRARQLMRRTLTPLSEEEWFDECRHGTGTTIGVPFMDTSPEMKLTLPMTATPGAAPWMEWYLQWDTSLAGSLIQPDDENLVVNLYKGRYLLVDGSRASTQPKNSEIERFICIEPTANMFLQQGLMCCLYKRMRSVGLDVSRLPDEHRKEAWINSITRKRATIDWSSASDCVSPALVKFLLPRTWYECLDMVRSKSIEIDGQDIELNMFSTMGNATTFPLETLVFWSLAQAVRSLFVDNTNSLLVETTTEISVFGDDCIVPEAFVDGFLDICESVGFLLNKEKTHRGNDAFRESCGGDFLSGTAVRPVSPKAPQSPGIQFLEPWLYITFNLVLRRYIQFFGELEYVYDREFFGAVFQLLTDHNLHVKIVPSYYPDDAGLKIGFDLERFRACYRFREAPIYRSKHGTYKFQFLKYQYNQNRSKDGAVRLSMWLKRPYQSKRKLLPSYKQKVGGGYVVGKGISSFWHLPD